jgi:predicted transcriptional regulator
MEGVQTRNGLYGYEYRDVDRRRSPDGERKTYEIKALWQRNHEIINLVAQGLDQVDVAEIVGVSPACVSQTVNSELGKRKLAEVRKGRDNEAIKTVEKIRILTNKALQVYHEIFDNESGEASIKDRKDAADTVVLELSGLRQATKIQSHHVSTVLTAEELQAFRERGRKAAEQSGMAIEVTEVPASE